MGLKQEFLVELVSRDDDVAEVAVALGSLDPQWETYRVDTSDLPPDDAAVRPLVAQAVGQYLVERGRDMSGWEFDGEVELETGLYAVEYMLPGLPVT